MSTGKRLLEPSDIPDTLWDSAAATLILPAALSSAYTAIIDRYGLRARSESRDLDNPPVGGISQEHTDLHFAQAFDGSAARAQLALLDPHDHLTAASNAYLTSIAGNRVSLTDAPCGAGPAALSFLCNIAELRAKDALPREPLDVHLIGAEISDPARKYARELLDAVRPFLEAQAINVECEFISWDVLSPASNTNLIQRMTLAAAGHPNRLLLVANFNSFLQRDGKRKEAQPHLSELFRYAAGPKSMAVWIEPDMNQATDAGGLLTWLRYKIVTAWNKFASEAVSPDAPIATSSAHFITPLRPGERARVKLAVIPIELAWKSQ